MRPEKFKFRLPPYEHQLKTFLETANYATYALFWEMGCGKSKTVIDNAAYLWECGKIDTLLVLAPNNVHRNWITDEVPAHMPRRHAPVIDMGFWESRKAKTIRHKKMALDAN